MKCKPGELAIVVGGYDPMCPPPLGAIVRVTRPNCHFPTCWEMSPPVFDPRDGCEVVIEDRHLLPIRDPGDDAVDESKAWLPPVPLPTIDPEMIPVKEKA
jgi:hypothetical protein